MEAVRKGDGADEQRAKVMGNFTTESKGGKALDVPFSLAMHSLLSTCALPIAQFSDLICSFLNSFPHFIAFSTDTTDIASSGMPMTASTAGEPSCVCVEVTLDTHTVQAHASVVLKFCYHADI